MRQYTDRLTLLAVLRKQGKEMSIVRQDTGLEDRPPVYLVEDIHTIEVSAPLSRNGS